jgi:hypothetical protein
MLSAEYCNEWHACFVLMRSWVQILAQELAILGFVMDILFLNGNTKIIPSIRPQSLPSTSVPVNYSSNILPLSTIESILLTV